MTQNKSNNILYYAIAIVLPVLFLLLIEGILRLADYKPQQPLFVPVTNMSGYLQPNPKVIQRFFPSPDMAPNVSPDTQYFLANKPEDSLRIVVQGGSTAAGFPYGRWGSLSGMLQQRFKRLYPEKNIEIINTAMASVNSYTLLDFVDEIIAIKPDVILIYAGHNEYLGIMGVGSAFASRGGRAANLLYLKFKNIKLYRLIEAIYYGLTSSHDGDAKTLDERTLMAKVAKEKDIPFQSALFQAGIEQFTDNMQLILDQYSKQKIPVIVGDLVSNEKDLIPFSAIGSENLSSLQTLQQQSPAHLQTRYKALKAKLDTHVNNVDTHNSKIETDGHEQPENQAGDYFLLGRIALALGHNEVAKQHFIKARDLDTLRFRAPQAFNESIYNLVKRNHVTLAQVQQHFRSDTNDGIIGHDHMLEHLHPNVRGYFVLAEAFSDALVQSGMLPKPSNDNAQLMWQEQPVTRVDEAYGAFKIKRLTSDYPFTNSPIKVELPKARDFASEALVARLNGNDWLSINQQLLKDYQLENDIAESAKIAGLLADALPNNPQVTFVAGMLYKKVDNLPLSVHHLLRAIKLNPDEINGRLSLAQNYFMLGQLDPSLEQLHKAKKLAPERKDIDGFIQMVKQASR